MQTLLQLPDSGSYSYNPAPRTARVQHEGAAGRFALLVPNKTARVAATWTLAATELNEFSIFYRKHAANQIPFEVDLVTKRAELRRCVAFFDVDTFSMSAATGISFVINCTLQVAEL